MVIVQGFEGSGLEVGDLLQTWTVDTFALKRESMRMERFEDIKGLAADPKSNLQGFRPHKEG